MLIFCLIIIFNRRNHRRSRSRNLHPRRRPITPIYFGRSIRFLASRWVLYTNKYTLYLRFVDHLWDKIVVVLLLEIVKRLLAGSFFLQFLYLHLVMVKLIVLRVAIFHNSIIIWVLMAGGVKSKANFYGMKPFGGPLFLFLLFYLPPFSVFGGSSLYLACSTQVLERRSS